MFLDRQKYIPACIVRANMEWYGDVDQTLIPRHAVSRSFRELAAQESGPSNGYGANWRPLWKYHWALHWEPDEDAVESDDETTERAGT
jgi:hypothetical protein